ncbi:MAG: host attachment protein [Lysobacterales bacterium]|jgi:protein required for attachment to host cells|nr:MAG: host attachment protein [Xanthomonadales bacterium]
MSRIRIVVADQAEAIFYDTPSLRARPREVAHLSDPVARLHDRDLVTDRPGRSYESVGSARHAITREDDPRHQEAVKFARRIARRLDDARRRDEFDDLIVVAGPPFLGMVRSALSRPTRERVVHEVRKDLVHSPVASLVRHLPATKAGLRPD